MGVCSDQLAVDGGAGRRLPLRNAQSYWLTDREWDVWLRGAEPYANDEKLPWLQALVAIKLVAGEHVLKFSSRYLGGSTTQDVLCRPGQITYLSVGASSDEGFWKRKLADWRIDISDTLPQSFLRRPLVLLDDGQWYVEAEPGD